MSRISLTTIVLPLVAVFAAQSPALGQRFGGGALRSAISPGGHGHSGGMPLPLPSGHGVGHGYGAGIALGVGVAAGVGRALQHRRQEGGSRIGSAHNNSQNYPSDYVQPNYQPRLPGGVVARPYVAPATGTTVLPQAAANYHPATQGASTEPPANVVPPAQNQPLATDPQVNELALVGRPLTNDEMRRARDFFKKRMGELTGAALTRLPAIECDRDKLISLFLANSIPAEAQVRILDAIRRDDFAAAQTLWMASCPGVELPFRNSRLRQRLGEFCSRWDAGECQPSDAELLERDLIALGLDDNACCGAPSLLEDIQQCMLVSQVIARANPGQQNQMLAVPPGEVDIVYHPVLPEGDNLVLGPQTVMLGTGGIGTFHLQHGNVAQAQGYPLLAGPGVQASDAPLTTEGILIENPTVSPVQFTIDKQPFSLPPGGSQVFTGDTRQIAFNTGDRNQVLTYALTKGTFRFDTPDRKWGLNRIKAFTTTIDNRNNSGPFRYIVQGEHKEVAPESVATHTSTYPLILRFDRGNGATTKQIASATKEATLIVGVNPQDNLWDLYDSSAPAVAAAAPLNVAEPVTARNRPAF